MLERAKIDYYSDRISTCKNDQKGLFKVLNELMKKSSESVIPECDSIENLVDKFNKYFVDKIEIIRENLKSQNCLYEQSKEPPTTQHLT